ATPARGSRSSGRRPAPAPKGSHRSSDGAWCPCSLPTRHGSSWRDVQRPQGSVTVRGDANLRRQLMRADCFLVATALAFLHVEGLDAILDPPRVGDLAAQEGPLCWWTEAVVSSLPVLAIPLGDQLNVDVLAGK